MLKLYIITTSKWVILAIRGTIPSTPQTYHYLLKNAIPVKKSRVYEWWIFCNLYAGNHPWTVEMVVQFPDNEHGTKPKVHLEEICNCKALKAFKLKDPSQ